MTDATEHRAATGTNTPPGTRIEIKQPRPTIEVVRFKQRRRRIVERLIYPITDWLYQGEMEPVGEDFMTNDEREMFGA